MFTKAIKELSIFLQKIGVESDILNEGDFEGILIKKMSNSNLLGEDKKDIKPDGTRNNQTHLDFTGKECLNFFFSQEEQNKHMSKVEVKEEIHVTLFKANIDYFEKIDKSIKGEKFIYRGRSYTPIEREKYVNDGELVSDSNIIFSNAIKKIGHADNAQVQINTPDSNDIFNYFRKMNYKGDILVLLKNNSNSYYAISIPYNEVDEYSNLNYKEVNKVILNANVLKRNRVDNDTLVIKEEDQTAFSSDKRKSLRKVNLDEIANYIPDDESDKEQKSFDLLNGIVIRKKRTERHNDIVKIVAKIFIDNKLDIYEGRIDCLGVKDREFAIISEIKTLDGTLSDENNQVMKAFSQLYYYEQFHMGDFSGIPKIKVAIFEKKISDEHIEFFRNNNIQVFWKEDGEIKGLKNLICKINL